MTLTLHERVGAGAHGEVWQARWGAHRVAAKVLHPTAGLAEAAALTAARHLRSIGEATFVELLDVTQHEGRWVLITEWVEGDDLTTVARRHGPAPEPAIHALLGTCATALRTAWHHDHRGSPLHLVHRDLKPENLLLEPTGRVRIADLGLASRLIRPDGRRGATPAWAAPERYLGEDGPAGDRYALGAIGLSLRTGRGLGVAGPHRAAHERRLRAAAADLAAAGTSPRLAELLLALLSWDPENRPSYDDLVALGTRTAALRSWGRPGLLARLGSWSRHLLPRPVEAACIRP